MTQALTALNTDIRMNHPGAFRKSFSLSQAALADSF